MREKQSLSCEEHIGLVHMLVARHRPAESDREDLVQAGIEGLLRALRDFDESRGVAFSTYAVPVIEGHLRDFLRRNSTVKIPRSLRTDAARLARAQETLGEGASLREAAKLAGLTEEAAALAAGVFTPPKSIAELCEEGVEPSVDEREYDALVDRLALSEGLSRLTVRDAALIRLRYYRRMTQTDTARVLSMTQVQVSRAEKRILAQLRAFLT